MGERTVGGVLGVGIPELASFCIVAIRLMFPAQSTDISSNVNARLFHDLSRNSSFVNGQVCNMSKL